LVVCVLRQFDIRSNHSSIILFFLPWSCTQISTKQYFWLEWVPWSSKQSLSSRIETRNKIFLILQQQRLLKIVNSDWSSSFRLVEIWKLHHFFC
jgi:hypothetical protein